MSSPADIPLGDTVPAAAALAAIDAVLASPACAGRAVAFALDDGTLLSRDELCDWLAEGARDGVTLARYIVDARPEGPVRVRVAGVEPLASSE